MNNMRRLDRFMSDRETIKVLENGEYGILATVGEEQYPYSVPLNYVFVDNFIYFHSSRFGGSKYDNIKANPKVSFAVVGDTEILSDKFGTLYESAIAFGTAEVVLDENERLRAFQELVKKYSAEFIYEGDGHIKESGPNAMVIKNNIDKISGKHRV